MFVWMLFPTLEHAVCAETSAPLCSPRLRHNGVCDFNGDGGSDIKTVHMNYYRGAPAETGSGYGQSRWFAAPLLPTPFYA